MNRTSTILLGLVTLIPAVCLVVTLVQMIDVFSEIAATGGSVEPGVLSQGIKNSLVASWISSIAMVPLVVFYVWHAAARASFSGQLARVIWIAALILVAPLAMPIYWYAHLWAPVPSGDRPLTP